MHPPTIRGALIVLFDPHYIYSQPTTVKAHWHKAASILIASSTTPTRCCSRLASDRVLAFLSYETPPRHTVRLETSKNLCFFDEDDRPGTVEWTNYKISDPPPFSILNRVSWPAHMFYTTPCVNMHAPIQVTSWVQSAWTTPLFSWIYPKLPKHSSYTLTNIRTNPIPWRFFLSRSFPDSTSSTFLFFSFPFSSTFFFTHLFSQPLLFQVNLIFAYALDSTFLFSAIVVINDVYCCIFLV